MHSTIEAKLQTIATTENLHFLWVVESGSRAWGFASPDSDYDVRGIYIRPPKHYLKIEAQKESFEWIENDWFDISAWDMQKSLRLLRKSNAALLEWTQSPIVYWKDSDFIAQWRELLANAIQTAPLLHHYRGVAKHSLQGIQLESPIRLKKWFYAVRALLAAHWVVAVDKLAPMTFADLLTAYPQVPRAEIDELLHIKATQKEDYAHLLSSHLQEWTRKLFQTVTHYHIADNGKNVDFDVLNQFFLQIIHRIYADN